jgi:molybdopterin-guanine dinucleotide biosynthesis protein A
MGADKGLLPVGGRPLILHVIDQLRGRFREVLVSANDPAAYAFTGLPLVRDREPGQGPLMGIASALEASRSDTLFVVACDIPEVDLPLARRLLAEASRYDCVVPRRGPDLLEPLFAVYRRSALPAIREALAVGERRIRRVFPRLRMRIVDAGDDARLENLNSPADLAAWLARRAGAGRTP